MNKLLTAIFCLIVAPLFAANPSFQSFNTSQFSTNAQIVGVKSGALLTNTFIDTLTASNNAVFIKPGYDQFSINTGLPQSIQTFANALWIFGGTSGTYFYNGNNTRMGYMGSTTLDPIIIWDRTALATATSQGNQVGSSRSSYFPRLGGSISSASDGILPTRS